MVEAGINEIAQMAEEMKVNIAKYIIGKEEAVDLLLTALIASGHILLEDVPGTGKTMLAKTVAASMECSFRRIQFTPDLLPSDLTGIHFYNQKEGEFEFRPGPLFANIVLADEINRATPRTQSSLLECMEERQISVDGQTHVLSKPFIVIATQNPVDNQGTFPLPEAQMDRFMLKMKLGYPAHLEGVEILKRTLEGGFQTSVSPVITQDKIISAQQAFQSVQVQEDLLQYMIAIAEATRRHPDIALGVSPRGTQALLRASQARAAIRNRDYVLPDDIKALALPVLSHRLVFHQRSRQQEGKAEALLQSIIEQIPVPSENMSSESSIG
ncbi:MoxR family ATPase [Paenibacillus sp. Marseille-Q4541]|uniref:AAA family ATPase n=1 Tax=Paenibacillus sp. Marseille-Q4541 TaxID=2831522 RepID=UPI001BAB745C|nr:MoxR family ATPase [Paenibacillus sp. Marseille-Q4541]